MPPHSDWIVYSLYNSNTNTNKKKMAMKFFQAQARYKHMYACVYMSIEQRKFA